MVTYFSPMLYWPLFLGPNSQRHTPPGSIKPPYFVHHPSYYSPGDDARIAANRIIPFSKGTGGGWPITALHPRRQSSVCKKIERAFSIKPGAEEEEEKEGTPTATTTTTTCLFAVNALAGNPRSNIFLRPRLSLALNSGIRGEWKRVGSGHLFSHRKGEEEEWQGGEGTRLCG